MQYFLPIGVALLIASMFLRYKFIFIGLAIASFTFYFGIEGENAFILLLFLIGLGLMIVELYVPDFGITGLLGLIASVYAIWLKVESLRSLTLLILFSFLVAVVVATVLMRMGFSLTISPRFVLKESMDRNRGYTSDAVDYSFLLDQVGVTLTDLRPVGRGQFNNEIYDVNSLEDMIGHGRQIRVVRVVGSRIYVRSVE